MTVNLSEVSIDGSKFQAPVTTSGELYKQLVRVPITDFTSGDVSGTGVFDTIMAGIKIQLQTEYDKGRITGADYTKAYIELTSAAMNAAMQFVLNRETSYWSAQQGQIAAVDALVRLETSRAQYAAARYNFETTLPAQTALTEAQTDLATKQVETAAYNLETTLPAQTAMINAQKLLVDAQKTVADNQADLVVEQTEVQRAQTLDTRLDGTTAVAGVLGKQKLLYAQQTTAYQRDSETKAAKLFTDAWITQKTIDEGLTAPTGFTNASIDDVLTAIKTNNGFT